MSDNATSQGSNKNIAIGSILIVIGLALGFFTYAHRPPTGLMDAMQRADTWVFNSQPYYIMLFIAALFAVAGIVRMVSSLKK